MRARHIVRLVQIGDGARQFQNAMKATRRQGVFLRGLADQFCPGGVELRDILNDAGRRGGVGDNPRQTQGVKTRALTRAVLFFSTARCNELDSMLSSDIRTVIYIALKADAVINPFARSSSDSVLIL